MKGIPSPFMVPRSRPQTKVPITDGNPVTVNKDNVKEVFENLLKKIADGGVKAVPMDVINNDFALVTVVLDKLNNKISVTGPENASFKIQLLCEAIAIIMPEAAKLLSIDEDAILDLVTKRIEDNPNRLREIP